MGWTDPAKYCYRSMSSFCRFLESGGGDLDEARANALIRKGKSDDPESVFTCSYLGDKPYKVRKMQG